MGLYEHWPYTNFHELNLNWIIQKLKEIEADISELDMDEMKADIQALKEDMTVALAEISDISDDQNSLRQQYIQVIDLCNQIYDLLNAAEVNPNIGYAQNQTLDTVTMNIIYNAMQSYQMDAWATTGHNITYGNYLTNNPSGTSGTPLDPDGTWSVCDKLDCSSFVILSLMGIPYGQTPFAGINRMTPRTTFSRQYKIKEHRNPDGLLRWASDIYEMAESEQMLMPIGDLSQLRTGDVVFWKYTDEAWNDLPEDSFAKADGGAYKRVAHVGMIVDSCSAFDSGVGVMQCVNTSATMAFQDINSYNPASLERMPYVMRPWKFKAVAEPTFNGLTTLRKVGGYNSALLLGDYSVSDHEVSFSGGKIPSNYIESGLDTNTGAIDESKTGRVTTDYIPFTPALVVEQGLSGVKYDAYYYGGDKTFQQYADNRILRPNANAKLVRLEFYNTSSGGVLTQAQKEYILEHTIIRYHIMADDYVSKNTGASGNTEADTFYYMNDSKLSGVNQI